MALTNVSMGSPRHPVMPLWGGGRHRPADTAALGVSWAGVFIGLSVRVNGG